MHSGGGSAQLSTSCLSVLQLSCNIRQHGLQETVFWCSASIVQVAVHYLQPQDLRNGACTLLMIESVIPEAVCQSDVELDAMGPTRQDRTHLSVKACAYELGL